MKKKALSLILFLFVALSVNAQIKYDSNGKLVVGPTSQFSFYPTTVYGSMYFLQNGGHFFQIDLTPAATRLASHYDQVVFYNTQTSAFNSIQVKNVYNYSDVRAKTNIQTLSTNQNSINKVLLLRPVSYNFKNNTNTTEYKVGGNGKEMGLIAQEVEQVLPNTVMTDPDGNKLINYTAIIPVLINAIQELNEKVTALEKSK